MGVGVVSTSDTGRELGYLHWPHEELAKAMVQAESDIEYLQGQLREMEEERDQFHRESRESAQTLGRILLALGHNACWPTSEPGEASNLQRPGARHRRFTRHVKVPDSKGMGSDTCSCGAAWLLDPNVCVNMHAEYVGRVSRERAERSSWSPL